MGSNNRWQIGMSKTSGYSFRFIATNTGGHLSLVDVFKFPLERLDELMDAQLAAGWFHVYKSLVRLKILTFTEDQQIQVGVGGFSRGSKSTLWEIDERPQMKA